MARDPLKDRPSELGIELRLARERSGRTLRQIADVTKLSVRTLEALEQNRVAQLPGGIYRRAIVRSYATEVGLDPEQTLQAFLALYPDDVPSAKAAEAHATPLDPSARRRGLVHSALNLAAALLPILDIKGR
jgi:cytoskeletal protein RodZ